MKIPILLAIGALLLSNSPILSKTNKLTNTTIPQNNPIPLTCICPHTCNDVWRHNNICDMECNIPECNWDDGDCMNQPQGRCIGNITIENIQNGTTINSPCNDGANTERICENSHYTTLDPPWRIKTYACKWVTIPQELTGWQIPIASRNCHSIVSCTSNQWCQQDCRNRIKKYPERCAWNPPPTAHPTQNPTQKPTKFPTRKPTKYPTKFPTKFPTKYPTTIQPTRSPTTQPTRSPTTQPTRSPTTQPTRSPTTQPTRSPTTRPTQSPTTQPTKLPTYNPTPLRTYPPHTHTPPQPPPAPPSPTYDHHHPHDPSSDDGIDTNKYDMAIAGIIIAAVVCIAIIIMYYRYIKHRTYMQQLAITRLQRNHPNIERTPRELREMIMGEPLPPIAVEMAIRK